MKIIIWMRWLLITVFLWCGLTSITLAQWWYDDVHVQWEVWCEEPAPTALAPKPEDCTDPEAHAVTAPAAAPAKIVAPKAVAPNKKVQKDSWWLFKSLKTLPQTGGSIEENIDSAEYQDFWKEQENAMKEKNARENQDAIEGSTDIWQNNDSGSNGNENFWEGVEVSQIEESSIPIILATIEANQELGEHASADIITKSLPTTLAWAFKYHPEDMIVIALLLAALFTITFI